MINPYDDWKKIRLKHISKNIGQYGANLSAENYLENGVRFLRTTDIQENGELITSKQGAYVDKSLIRNYLLQPNDILFSRSGTLGRSYLHRNNTIGDFAFAGYLVRFRLNHLVHPKFIFYVSKSSEFLVQIEADAIQSTISNFNGEKYGNIGILIPPLEAQKLIACFLDRKTAAIDTLIVKKKRLIQLLEEKRTALINQAVTKGLNPNAPMKDSGIPWIGKIPEHWEAVHLKRAIASSDYGISNQLEPIGKYPVLRMGNLQNGEVLMDSIKYVDEVDPLLVLKSNDILFNRTNSLDLVGKVALFQADPGVEVTFASYLVRFRSNVLAIPAYLVLFLGRQDVQKIARAMALPAIGQVNLNPNRYGYLQICLPPCSEQIEIVAWLREKMRKLQELINKNNNQIEKLQEYRRSLITSAVTGKIDIREKDAA